VRLKPGAIQGWFNELAASPRYKGKIKAVLQRLFEKAMLWEYVESRAKSGLAGGNSGSDETRAQAHRADG